MGPNVKSSPVWFYNFGQFEQKMKVTLEGKLRFTVRPLLPQKIPGCEGL